tara:strand:- start:14 stop:622 length:609 start_codon:yes stop_codon:yes gene_type:complete
MSWLDNMIPFLKEQEAKHDQRGEDVEGKTHSDGSSILTFGYGHRDNGNNISSKVSNLTSNEYEAWSDSTLKSDLTNAAKRGRQAFSNRYSGTPHNVQTKNGTYTTDHSVYDNLTDDAKSIITDFQFNIGHIKGWPKLMKALINEDWEKAEIESIRFLNGKKLGKRNNDTFEKFIEPNLKRNQGTTTFMDGVIDRMFEKDIFS